MLIVIKNVKHFPADSLNDLIHVLKKYRQNKRNERGLNLMLLLGLQSSSKDEIFQRISVSNCAKLIIKAFYFLSMKNIIFDIIYHILVDPSIYLTFSRNALKNVIQQINTYGVSIEKFKRMLKLMIASYTKEDSSFCFIHLHLPERLLSEEKLKAHFSKKREEILGDLNVFTRVNPKDA